MHPFKIAIIFIWGPSWSSTDMQHQSVTRAPCILRLMLTPPRQTEQACARCVAGGAEVSTAVESGFRG